MKRGALHRRYLQGSMCMVGERRTSKQQESLALPDQPAALMIKSLTGLQLVSQRLPPVLASNHAYVWVHICMSRTNVDMGVMHESHVYMWHVCDMHVHKHM